jgi:membrane associated rhomboid family serine protease
MVVPLWDTNPFRKARHPYATWSLLLFNIAVFVYSLGTVPGNFSDHLQATIIDYGVIPATVTRDVPSVSFLPPWFSLVTYQFFHADIFHLLGNTIFLWVFGDDVEEAVGHWKFLLFYLLCGIGSAAAYVASIPHSGIPLVGASGAIAGVLAGYLMFRPCQKIWVLFFRIPLRLSAYWVIGAWAVVQLWQIAHQTDDGVAYMAHAGGFLAGAVLFPLMRAPGIKLFECVRERKPPAQPPVAPVSAGGRASR